MGSDMFLSGFAEKNRVREAESDRARAVEGERKALNERDAALGRVAELEAQNKRLFKENAELHEALGNMVSGHNGPIEPIDPEPYMQEIESLREDNARLIRAVCALAEREVKRSEVGDE